MVKEISSDSLKAYINKLVTFGTRSTLSTTTDKRKGIGAAREWVVQKFNEFGKASNGRLTAFVDTTTLQPDKRRVDVATSLGNSMAILKGTDPNDNRVYLISGHLDSRVTDVLNRTADAPGANDDGSGVAAVLECARVMSKRSFPATIIFVAVSGEEQGLLGSRNYVRNRLSDTTTRKANVEGEKVSVYFNLDNGTGKIRGVYLQGNQNVRPVFEKWLEPFNDLGATTLTLQNTGGTDHLSFDGVGIPGFQFIQDPIEYSTRTHHTNMDSYDHLIADDLKQAATIVAAFVYNAAMREEKIPRK